MSSSRGRRARAGDQSRRTAALGPCGLRPSRLPARPALPGTRSRRDHRQVPALRSWSSPARGRSVSVPVAIATWAAVAMKS